MVWPCMCMFGQPKSVTCGWQIVLQSAQVYVHLLARRIITSFHFFLFCALYVWPFYWLLCVRFFFYSLFVFPSEMYSWFTFRWNAYQLSDRHMLHVDAYTSTQSAVSTARMKQRQKKNTCKCISNIDDLDLLAFDTSLCVLCVVSYGSLAIYASLCL